jgi:hypothetical protein
MFSECFFGWTVGMVLQEIENAALQEIENALLSSEIELRKRLLVYFQFNHPPGYFHENVH